MYEIVDVFFYSGHPVLLPCSRRSAVVADVVVDRGSREHVVVVMLGSPVRAAKNRCRCLCHEVEALTLSTLLYVRDGGAPCIVRAPLPGL